MAAPRVRATQWSFTGTFELKQMKLSQENNDYKCDLERMGKVFATELCTIVKSSQGDSDTV